jgi:putative phosphoesterase
MRVVVLADTHLRGDGLDRLPSAVLAAIDEADVVLHAGDVVSPGALAALEGRTAAAGADFYAVLSNNDSSLHGRLPASVIVEIGGVAVGMVHDAGRRDGRAARLHRRFPTGAVVVFGHSHVPGDDIGVDGQRLFNPGSPTERRAQPHRTFGRLELAGGLVRDHRIVPI